ncbi:MAG: SAM-dependent methyltransferase [Nitrososphaerales archaeon]
MRLEEAKRDRYRRQAKLKGYRSRAAFKLIQIDDRYNIIAQGISILDIGCYPGGWLQVASERVGPHGSVVGIDTREVIPLGENTRIYKGDITDQTFIDTIVSSCSSMDLVLSDLAPNVSGIWELDHGRQVDLTEKVIRLLPLILKEGGTALLKIFEGDLIRTVWDRASGEFSSLKYVKPKASRAKSSELYLLCRNFLSRKPTS